MTIAFYILTFQVTFAFVEWHLRIKQQLAAYRQRRFEEDLRDEQTLRLMASWKRATG